MGLFKLNIEKMKSSGDIESLINALKHTDENVKFEASEALADLGAPAVEQLIETLKYDEHPSRKLVIITLGKIGDKRAIKPLNETLNDEDRYVRRCAVEALNRIGAPLRSDDIAQLIDDLMNSDLNSRKQAARKLGKIGDSRAVESLFDITVNWPEDKSLRKDAEKAILSIGKKALKPLIEKLDWEVPGFSARKSWEAARLLGRMGDSQAVKPLAAQLKENNSLSVYIVAIGQIGGEEAARVLVKALKYKEYRPSITRWLKRIGEEAVDPLINHLGDKELGTTAANVLIKIGEPAVKLLTIALENPDPAVRIAAAKALRKLEEQKNPEKIVKKPRSKRVKMGATCSRCKKQLKGKDLERLKKYKENMMFFKSQPNVVEIPFMFAEITDYTDSIFYCQECINRVENWEEKDKNCITCDFFLINFVALPGVPDMYCRSHGNNAVYQPKEESCKDWRLTYRFNK